MYRDTQIHRMSIWVILPIVILALVPAVSQADMLSISAEVAGDEEEEGPPGTITSGGKTGVSATKSAVVTFSGYSYPEATVYLLLNGISITEASALVDGTFSLTLSGLGEGVYTFSIVGEDRSDRRSILYTIPLFVQKGAIVTVKNIFLSPTLEVNTSFLAPSEKLILDGETLPNALLTFTLSDGSSFNTSALSSGIYRFTWPALLGRGEYELFAKATRVETGETSAATSLYSLTVSDGIRDASICKDLNGDTKINLIDFSILAYWFERENPPPSVDLVLDGEITLSDFSILAYCWTG